ncbi:hypothetical protein PMKS-004117 [Pichia membranifaciens]|uniref:Uncharacterized protein n=1 Tax=Pichia membranifaciens TaxID=4926 RepID=A0A1Q2YMK0_9ASCO|nr:hypothetical protein PMKS-004117 [Pichia membranifaciens]
MLFESPTQAYAKKGVIGASRSEVKILRLLKNFKEKYPDGNLIFKIVSDILSKNGFDDILKGHSEIKFVCHTASFHPGVKQKPNSLDVGSSTQESSLEEIYLKPDSKFAIHN